MNIISAMDSLEEYLKQLMKEAVQEVLLSELEKGTFDQISKPPVTTAPNFEKEEKNKPEAWTILRPKQLAENLSVSLPTLYRMEANGELSPKIQLTGRSVGWRYSDIEEWVENRKRSPRQ